MSEFDARSKVPNDPYRQNYDRVFARAKVEREDRSEERKRFDESRGSDEQLGLKP